MIEDARITFYRISRCGYYKRRAAEAQFGSLAETLNDLTRWTKDKSLGETCTYQVRETDSFGHTYCFSTVAMRNGSFLLTLWNETPSRDGNVASVNPNAPVGSVTVASTAVPKNNIPGFASYFWFIPERHLVATIVLENRISGHHAMSRFMHGFLARFGSHVVTKEPNDGSDAEQLVLGYRDDAGSLIQRLLPSFRYSVVTRPQRIEEIKSRRTDIRKLLCKEELDPKIVENETIIKKLLNLTGISEPDTLPTQYRVKYEITHSPTAEELEEIIAEWQPVAENENTWEDVGFLFKSDSQPHWLSHSIERHKIKVSVSRDFPEVINGRSLLKALEDQRGNLVKSL